MHHDVVDIIKNIQDLYENNSNLGILKDFERVLDELDLYVYENWENGELAYGPKVDRHFITAGFMWPRKNMPDPDGGKRLLELNCKIKYQKSHLIEPRSIKTQEDIRPNSKKGKLDRNPIWIVEIQMPKQLAFDMYHGYMSKLKNENKDLTALPDQGTPVPGAPAATTPPPMPGLGGGMPPPGGGMPPMGGGMPGGSASMPM